MLRTAISAWISWMSSSFDSRSICKVDVSSCSYVKREPSYTYMFDGNSLASGLLDSLVDDSETPTYI